MTQLARIAVECEAIGTSRRQHLPSGAVALSEDEAVAVASYTFDLQVSVGRTDTHPQRREKRARGKEESKEK